MNFGILGRDSPSFRSMASASRDMNRGITRLSSGKRLNSAADDAAGVAVAQKLMAQLESLEQASRNVNDGISLAQTADGAMASQGEMVGRMRELAVQSANGTLGDDERAAIQAEFDELAAEVDRVAGSTNFNGQPIMSGDSIDIQVGTDGTGDDVIAVDTSDQSAAALGLEGVSVSNPNDAKAALATLDNAIEQISTSRGQMGAKINRLSSVQNSIATEIETTASSFSRIADGDMAEESSIMTMARTRMQASIGVQQQSNASKGLLISLMT